ncbi:MAG TPA: 2,3-dihydroxybenzoate-AMP ligase, partial [Spirillospora sp.]
YYRAPEHNARAFTADGWYRTGDIVRQRPDGNLVVEGRDKDMINRAGENISAEEIENFAYRVPGISLAAAVAMPDPELGERVCLYAVTDRDVTLQDVHDVMERAGAARFKFPDRLVVVDSLPTTKVGKIDKKALRADIARRLTEEQPARH